MTAPESLGVRRHRPRPWGLAAFGLAVLSSLVMAWDLIGDAPVWAMLAAVTALAIGAGCFTVATVLHARNRHVSGWRLVGRALWAPIRFLLDF